MDAVGWLLLLYMAAANASLAYVGSLLGHNNWAKPGEDTWTSGLLIVLGFAAVGSAWVAALAVESVTTVPTIGRALTIISTLVATVLPWSRWLLQKMQQSQQPAPDS